MKLNKPFGEQPQPNLHPWANPHEMLFDVRQAGSDANLVAPMGQPLVTLQQMVDSVNAELFEQYSNRKGFTVAPSWEIVYQDDRKRRMMDTDYQGRPAATLQYRPVLSSGKAGKLVQAYHIYQHELSGQVVWSNEYQSSFNMFTASMNAQRDQKGQFIPTAFKTEGAVMRDWMLKPYSVDPDVPNIGQTLMSFNANRLTPNMTHTNMGLVQLPKSIKDPKSKGDGMTPSLDDIQAAIIFANRTMAQELFAPARKQTGIMSPEHYVFRSNPVVRPDDGDPYVIMGSIKDNQRQDNRGSDMAGPGPGQFYHKRFAATVFADEGSKYGTPLTHVFIDDTFGMSEGGGLVRNDLGFAQQVSSIPIQGQHRMIDTTPAGQVKNVTKQNLEKVLFERNEVEVQPGDFWGPQHLMPQNGNYRGENRGQVPGTQIQLGNYSYSRVRDIYQAPLSQTWMADIEQGTPLTQAELKTAAGIKIQAQGVLPDHPVFSAIREQLGLEVDVVASMPQKKDRWISMASKLWAGRPDAEDTVIQSWDTLKAFSSATEWAGQNVKEINIARYAISSDKYHEAYRRARAMADQGETWALESLDKRFAGGIETDERTGQMYALNYKLRALIGEMPTSILQTTSSGKHKLGAQMLNLLSIEQPNVANEIIGRARKGEFDSAALEIVRADQMNRLGVEGKTLNYVNLQDIDLRAYREQAIEQAGGADKFRNDNEILKESIALAAKDPAYAGRYIRTTNAQGKSMYMPTLDSVAKGLTFDLTTPANNRQFQDGWESNVANSLTWMMKLHDKRDSGSEKYRTEWNHAVGQMNDARQALTTMAIQEGTLKSAATWEMDALTGKAASAPFLRTDHVIVDEERAQNIIQRMDLSKQEKKELLQRFRRGEMTAAFYMQLSDESGAYKGVRIMSKEYAQRNFYPDLKYYEVPKGGALASESLIGSENKDVDGDQWAIIPLIGNYLNDKEFFSRTTFDRAMLGRGEEVQSYIKKALSGPKFLDQMLSSPMAWLDDSVKMTLAKAKAKLESQAESTSHMGLSFGPYVEQSGRLSLAWGTAAGLEGDDLQGFFSGVQRFGNDVYQRAMDMKRTDSKASQWLQAANTSLKFDPDKGEIRFSGDLFQDTFGLGDRVGLSEAILTNMISAGMTPVRADITDDMTPEQKLKARAKAMDENRKHYLGDAVEGSTGLIGDHAMYIAQIAKTNDAEYMKRVRDSLEQAFNSISDPNQDEILSPGQLINVIGAVADRPDEDYEKIVQRLALGVDASSIGEMSFGAALTSAALTRNTVNASKNYLGKSLKFDSFSSFADQMKSKFLGFIGEDADIVRDSSKARRGELPIEKVRAMFDRIGDRPLFQTPIFAGPNEIIQRLTKFDRGGYTGHGEPLEERGVVHAGEYVLDRHDVQDIQQGKADKVFRKVSDEVAGNVSRTGSFFFGGLVGDDDRWKTFVEGWEALKKHNQDYLASNDDTIGGEIDFYEKAEEIAQGYLGRFKPYESENLRYAFIAKTPLFEDEYFEGRPKPITGGELASEGLSVIHNLSGFASSGSDKNLRRLLEMGPESEISAILHDTHDIDYGERSHLTEGAFVELSDSSLVTDAFKGDAWSILTPNWKRIPRSREDFNRRIPIDDAIEEAQEGSSSWNEVFAGNVGIKAVHLKGNPANSFELYNIAREHGIPLIEHDQQAANAYTSIAASTRLGWSPNSKYFDYLAQARIAREINSGDEIVNELTSHDALRRIQDSYSSNFERIYHAFFADQGPIDPRELEQAFDFPVAFEPSPSYAHNVYKTSPFLVDNGYDDDEAPTVSLDVVDLSEPILTYWPVGGSESVNAFWNDTYDSLFEKHIAVGGTPESFAAEGSLAKSALKAIEEFNSGKAKPSHFSDYEKDPPDWYTPLGNSSDDDDDPFEGIPFWKGGFTGQGEPMEPVGTVHAGEYVLDRHDLSDIKSGKGERVLQKVMDESHDAPVAVARGFADGGSGGGRRKPSNHGQDWNDSDRQKALRWRREGLSYGQIGKRLGRTASAVRSQVPPSMVSNQDIPTETDVRSSRRSEMRSKFDAGPNRFTPTPRGLLGREANDFLSGLGNAATDFMDIPSSSDVAASRRSEMRRKAYETSRRVDIPDNDNIIAERRRDLHRRAVNSPENVAHRAALLEDKLGYWSELASYPEAPAGEALPPVPKFLTEGDLTSPRPTGMRRFLEDDIPEDMGWRSDSMTPESSPAFDNALRMAFADPLSLDYEDPHTSGLRRFLTDPIPDTADTDFDSGVVDAGWADRLMSQAPPISFTELPDDVMAEIGREVDTERIDDDDTRRARSRPVGSGRSARPVGKPSAPSGLPGSTMGWAGSSTPPSAGAAPAITRVSPRRGLTPTPFIKGGPSWGPPSAAATPFSHSAGSRPPRRILKGAVMGGGTGGSTTPPPSTTPPAGVGLTPPAGRPHLVMVRLENDAGEEARWLTDDELDDLRTRNFNHFQIGEQTADAEFVANLSPDIHDIVRRAELHDPEAIGQFGAFMKAAHQVWGGERGPEYLKSLTGLNGDDLEYFGQVHERLELEGWKGKTAAQVQKELDERPASARREAQARRAIQTRRSRSDIEADIDAVLTGDDQVALGRLVVDQKRERAIHRVDKTVEVYDDALQEGFAAVNAHRDTTGLQPISPQKAAERALRDDEKFGSVRLKGDEVTTAMVNMDEFAKVMGRVGEITDRVTKKQEAYIKSGQSIVDTFESITQKIARAEQAVSAGQGSATDHDFLNQMYAKDSSGQSQIDQLEAAQGDVKKLAEVLTLLAAEGGVQEPPTAEERREARRDALLATGKTGKRAREAMLASGELDEGFFGPGHETANRRANLAFGVGGRLYERLISGEGLFRSRMAWNMFGSPSFDMLAQSRLTEASVSQGMFSAGGIGFEDLMGGGYGQVRRLGAQREMNRRQAGHLADMAYGDIYDSTASQGFVGIGQAILGPAIGAGMTASIMTGSPAFGSLVGGAVAVYGAANISQEAMGEHLAMAQYLRGDSDNVVGRLGVVNNRRLFSGRLFNGMTQEEMDAIERLDELIPTIGNYINGYAQDMTTSELLSTGRGRFNMNAGQMMSATQTMFNQAMFESYSLGPEASEQIFRDIMSVDSQNFAGWRAATPMAKMMVAGIQDPMSLAREIASGQGASTIDSEAIFDVLDQINEILDANQEAPDRMLRLLQNNVGRGSQINLMRGRLGIEARDIDYEDYPDLGRQSILDEAEGLQLGILQQGTVFGQETAGRFMDRTRTLLSFGFNQQAMTYTQQYGQAASFESQIRGTAIDPSTLSQALERIAQENPEVFARSMALASGNRMAWSQTGDVDRALLDPNTGLGAYEENINNAEFAKIEGVANRWGLMGPNRDRIQAAALRGTRGLQQAIRVEQRDIERQQFEMQMTQMSLSDLTTRGSTTGIDGQGFATGGSGLAALAAIYAQRGMNFNPGNGMSQWEIQDAGTRIGRAQEDFGLRQAAQQLSMAAQQFEVSGRQQQAQFNLEERRFAYQNQFNTSEMNRNRRIEVEQQSWRIQDLQFQRAEGELSFGWQMEDFDRGIRYSRGRERRDLMRQQSRAVISFSMQQGRLDTMEGRNEQQTQWENESFEVRRDHLQQEIRFTRESMDMARRHWEENRQFERRRLDMERESHQQRIGWVGEQRELEDQSRLLERQAYEINFDMSKEMTENQREATLLIQEYSDFLEASATTQSNINALLDKQVSTGELAIEVSEELGSAYSNFIGKVSGELEKALKNAANALGSGATVSVKTTNIVGQNYQNPPKQAAATPKPPGSMGNLGGSPGVGGGSPKMTYVNYSEGGYVEPLPGFDDGGFTGFGHTLSPAGIVHGQEYVIPQHGVPVLRDGGQMDRMINLLEKILAVMVDLNSQGINQRNTTINTTNLPNDLLFGLDDLVYGSLR